jgi:hypothetical protein
MNVRIFNFPCLQDGETQIEKVATELELRERRGQNLEPEERDWLDWANSVTIQSTQTTF